MNINDVNRSMMKRFRTVDGASFLGELIKPQAQTSRPDNFDNARRLLRTGIGAAVDAGTIMVTGRSRYYLLALHDDDETPRLQTKTFTLFEVPSVITWERMTTALDTVTQLPKETAKARLGTIRCAMEAPSTIREAGLAVRKATYRVITAASLQLGDILDGDKRVVTLATQLGVNFAGTE